MAIHRVHLSILAADKGRGGRVVGDPVRPSKRVELQYRATLMRIVGWCEGVGRQILADIRPHWRVADGLALDARKPKHPHELAEATRIVARKVTDVRNKRGIVRMSVAEVDKRLAKSVKAAIGVDITELLNLQSGGDIAVAMQLASAQNAALIESIPAKYLARVNESVRVAFGTGVRFEALAKEVERIGGVTARRARFIARDQTAKLNSAFSQIRMVGAGITSYIWSTSRDERVRVSHRPLNGEKFQFASPPDVGGEHLNPGEDYNCRCVALPVIEAAEVAGEQEPERAAA